MKIVDLNDKLTVNFKSNYLPTKTDIKEKKSTLNQIDIYNSQEDFTSSAKVIYNELIDLSLINLLQNSLANIGFQAFGWLKIAESNPYISDIIFDPNNKDIYVYLDIVSSNVLSLFNLRRDISSLDATQWGKGAEFAVKYGILPKAGLNTTNIINNSYKKLCENLNRAQSLQLRLDIAGLETSWDASSFSLGFEELIKQQTQEGESIYGFVKGLATSFNNKGDYKIYEVLDAVKKAIKFQDDEVLGIVPYQSKEILNFINTIFTPPFNLTYTLSLYEKNMKYNLLSNYSDNLFISLNSYEQNTNYPFEADYRGTPITTKLNTSESILI